MAINKKALVILAVVAIGYYVVNNKPKGPDAFDAAYQNAPTVEKDFVSIVKDAQDKAKSAENDMQLGGIKAQRDALVCSVVQDKHVNEWIGKVDTMSSNSDGKGVVSISLSEDINVKTWNNDISDYGDHTLITPGSELFETASQLKEGDIVRFSGKFISDSQNCIRESSLGIRGKVTEPEYIFQFNSIAKI
ncbi:hypothetical protein SAMN05216522_10522 [Rosenbergiella nectarea]|uniref:Uncharacterized protein n=1 Tax=Rosenbergiella nectarea TaxID=988801 RepID=A0A1H9HQU8_9GAMM|nr:hypothetical protein [Rosenbergiella nectarea]SEQ64719.1 hypothetical protein SAMN05216522_10522 [Rosenbergiella nectarea]